MGQGYASVSAADSPDDERQEQHGLEDEGPFQATDRDALTARDEPVQALWEPVGNQAAADAGHAPPDTLVMRI